MVEPLAELFASKVRAAVLSHLLPRPHLGFSLTDLSRLLGLPISSLQHECYKLARIGVFRHARLGNARLYRPDPRSPLLPSLTALVVAAIGPEAALQAALEGMPTLESALLSGDLVPVLGPVDPPQLVLVGELTLEEVDGAFARVVVALGGCGGQVELAFFRPADWHERRAAGNRYVADVLDGPRLDLVP